MKQTFIQRNNKEDLILFFTGWGMDTFPHLELKNAQSDIALCFDYTDAHWDETPYLSYNQITIIAWSMGVFAANEALSQSRLPIVRSIAVNGTLSPINDREGIPCAVFEATLSHLDEDNRLRFYRRMCGSKTALQSFLSTPPQRSIRSLSQELAALGQRAQKKQEKNLCWDCAIIGQGDRIFPPINQRNAWIGNSKTIEKRDVAHWFDLYPLIATL